jgi:exonuclease III
MTRFFFLFDSCGFLAVGQLESCFFVHQTIISADKRVGFVSDRMSYIILRGCWCHISVLNVHAPTEDETDDVKDSFYEELERMFDKFPKYHMKILLGDFNAKVGREDIFKPTIGNESLYEISNDNGVRLVNLPRIKTSESKVQSSHIATSIDILELLQMGKPTIRLTIFW